MKKTVSRRPIAGLTFLLTLLTCLPALADRIDKDFHESFPVTAGSVLYLDHGDGEVDIQPWEQDLLDIEVRYHVEYSKVGIGSEPDFDVTFRQEGDDIHIAGVEEGSFVIGSLTEHRYEYTYTIRGPRTVILDLKGEDGDVFIADWSGDISCHNEDGDISLARVHADRVVVNLEDGDLDALDLTGDVSIESEDGEVKLAKCRLASARLITEDGEVEVASSSGNFRVEAEDGDVVFRDVECALAEVRSEDGDIRLELVPTPDLDLDAESGDGDITVSLGTGASAIFTITTGEGDIDVGLSDATLKTEREDRVTGQVGDGKARVRLRSQDGSIILKD